MDTDTLGLIVPNRRRGGGADCGGAAKSKERPALAASWGNDSRGRYVAHGRCRRIVAKVDHVTSPSPRC